MTPLNDSEYNRVAVWLHRQGLRPADLLEEDGRQKLLTEDSPLPAPRLSELLERGVALALAVEGWTNKGLWVLSRSDDSYPKGLKGPGRRSQAPSVLYGAGDLNLISGGGLAIVGSREASEEVLDFARRVARACAEQVFQVISGGARGVDNEAMTAALTSGGSAVGVLANDLARTATRGKYRSAIQDGTLTLISPYDPGSGFIVGHAMRRNRYIYNLQTSEWWPARPPAVAARGKGLSTRSRPGNPCSCGQGARKYLKETVSLLREEPFPSPKSRGRTSEKASRGPTSPRERPNRFRRS